MVLFVLSLMPIVASSQAAEEARVAVWGEAPHNAFLTAARDLGLVAEVQPDATSENFDALLVCAPDYPRVTPLPEGVVQCAERFLAAGKAVYVEYAPTFGLLEETPRTAGFERLLVIGEGRAVEGLEARSILEEHTSRYLPLTPAGEESLKGDSGQILLSYGRAAGVDRTVFGLPKETWPALVEIRRGGGRLLLAATALSNCARGRYKPTCAWATLLRSILLALLPEAKGEVVKRAFIDAEAWTEPRQWVAPGEPVTLHVKAEPSDRVVAAGPGGPVALRPEDDGTLASRALALTPGKHRFRVTVSRGEARRRELTVDLEVSPRAERYRDTVYRNLRWFERAGMLVAPDGTGGVREGLTSAIAPDGQPSVAGGERVDCVSECALLFCVYGRALGDERWAERGRRLFERVATVYQIASKDSWYYGQWQSRGEFRDDSTVYVFNDDSGAATLFSLLGFAYTGDRRLLEAGLRGVEYFCHVASEKTGLFGSMPHRDYKGSGRPGTPWPVLRGLDVSGAAPHVMNLPLAALLVAYRVTGEDRYFAIARRGIETLMEAYPNWGIVTSRTCEHTRMLLPLALLVQMAPTPEHRRWLDTVVSYLEEKQASCGALAEWDGNNPASNAAFGTTENSIFQENGDPISDQLYNTGFAALHLRLAYEATGDDRVRRIFERLADYLTRIQLRDPNLLYDGAWLRAFDYGRWEYFGSSADIGWGPYCCETGWMCAPLCLGLLLSLGREGPTPGTSALGLPARPEPRWRALAKAAREEADEVEAALSAVPSQVRDLRALPSRGPYARLEWTAPQGRTVAYRIHRAEKPDFITDASNLVAEASGGSWMEAGLIPETDYYYRVVAVNGLGQAGEPSPAVRVTTGPASKARGCRYTKSLVPSGAYGDAGEAESTDGLYAGDYRDGKSYGYQIATVGDTLTLEITMDLGRPCAVACASHHNCGAPGYHPDEMAVSVSMNGVDWARVGATTKHNGDFMAVEFAETIARFVRFHFVKQRREQTDDWLFIDELEVY